MKRLAAVAALCGLLATAAPARAVEERLRIYDLSADVLEPGTWELGVFWARYRRGVLPWLHLQTHLAGDVLGVPNASARVRLLATEDVRATFEAGVAWVALMLLAPEGQRPTLLLLPMELRATVPLAETLELNVAWAYRLLVDDNGGSSLGTSSLRQEVSLARYDATGAWMLTAAVPLFSRASARLDRVLGSSELAGVITLDDVAAWSVLVARDTTFGRSGHVRVGLGYRNRPGVILYDSLGRLLVSLDLYWR